MGRMGIIADKYAIKTTQNACHVRPEDAPVDMGLIQHHKGQRCQKGCPALMVGQYPQMQHLRVGDEHSRRIFAYLCPHMLGRVAVIQGNWRPGMLGPVPGQAFQDIFLVLGQGL